MSTEEQLISFFAYSFLIYPITNYLVSPQRKYSRVYGVLFAILFLSLTSYLHLLYETKETGPNHYTLLNVTRLTSTGELKKAYRHLSRELHPDRNHAPTAADDFNRVKLAFDVLVDPETRDLYDRLGETAVKASVQSVIDHKYVVVQMFVYYCSSSILAFFMTFSEPSGEALSVSFFAMAVMLLVECAFVLQSASLPAWLLPTTTPHEIVSILHRFFPAFMSGCRCIIGAFHVELKDKRVEVLEPAISSLQSCANHLFHLLRLQMENLENRLILSQEAQSSDSTTKLIGEGIMERASKQAKVQIDAVTLKSMNDKIALISKPELLSEQKEKNGLLIILRNFVIYFMVRLMVMKVMSGPSSK